MFLIKNISEGGRFPGIVWRNDARQTVGKLASGCIPSAGLHHVQSRTGSTIFECIRSLWVVSLKETHPTTTLIVFRDCQIRIFVCDNFALGFWMHDLQLQLRILELAAVNYSGYVMDFTSNTPCFLEVCKCLDRCSNARVSLQVATGCYRGIQDLCLQPTIAHWEVARAS